MSPRRVVLHIDELVLHGFPSEARHQIGEAVQRELVRLLSQQGVPTALARTAAREHVEGGTLRLGAADTPAQTGAQVARAVYGGLAR
jgi:hypothetical protein